MSGTIPEGHGVMRLLHVAWALEEFDLAEIVVLNGLSFGLRRTDEV